MSNIFDILLRELHQNNDVLGNKKFSGKYVGFEPIYKVGPVIV
jgi:hypothetical protein